MIELTKSYKVGDKIFATFREAQLDALINVFANLDPAQVGGAAGLADFTMQHKDEVLAILSMSEPAKRGRKPRSDVGKKHLGKKAKRALKEIESMEPASPVESTVEGSGKYAGK